MCLGYTDKILKAAVIEIVPTLDMWSAMDKVGVMLGWHWSFMAQPVDLQERVMHSVLADWFLRKKLLKFTSDLNHILLEIWS